MEQKWYYIVEGVQQGPVTLEELQRLVRSGELGSGSLVWQPEFGAEWRRVGSVAELGSGGASRIGVEAGLGGFTLPRRGGEYISWSMAATDGESPSVIEALQRAWVRTKRVLFGPMIAARWFSIGFCAWLAYLGSRVGQSLGGIDLSKQEQVKKLAEEFKEGSGVSVWDKLLTPEAMTAIALVFLLWGLIMIWMCSIRSRGDFMLMHRWYKPDEQAWRCWHAARGPARVLFIWRVKIFLLVSVILLLTGGAAFSYVGRPFIAAGYEWSVGMVLPTALCGGMAVVVLLVSGVVTHLTKAFVVPIMYWHGGSVGEAWQMLFALGNSHPFALIRYLVTFYLLQVGAEMLVVMLVLFTCCLGLIPLSLPFLHVVFLLPIYYFYRGFSTEFLSQWRADIVPGGDEGERL